MNDGYAAAEMASRLRAKDVTLWPSGSDAPTRLGWVDIADRLLPQCEEVMAWAASISCERVVLIGMGGSSLGPEVLRAAVGSDRLVVCDTTDPVTVSSIPADDSFFLVSSKSGSTLEPRAVSAYFNERVPDPSRWAAVTDPDTQLFEESTAAGYSRVFENDPDIGGRYSVLSWFGLVPAALMGIDIFELCRRALEADFEDGARFGTEMADAAREGRDKLTIHVPSGPFGAFGLWAEQLVAESLGKQGQGIVPVPTADDEPGSDRHHVRFEVDDVLDLGAEMLRWEVATAVAGSVLGLDPFDQPDVESAKVETRRALDDLPLPDKLPDGVDTVALAGLGSWLEENTAAGDYVTVQAYLPFGQDSQLEALRRSIRDQLSGQAVTAGYGPRFLHSTGQLHKGGPSSCVAVQIVPDRPTAQVEVPGLGYDFATLIEAQALGDLAALRTAGRRVARVTVEGGRLP